MTSSRGINDIFKEFYENLYRSSGTPNKALLQQFFTNIHRPNLSSEQAAFLDEPVTHEEVKHAIMAMKAGKSPGTHGFPVEYYKIYIDIITPILTNVFQEIFKQVHSHKRLMMHSFH